MKTLALSFLLLAGATTIVSGLEGPTSRRDGWQSMRFHETEPIIYPHALLDRAILSGDARVVVSVDPEGTITDMLVVGYSNVEFADAALRAMSHWKYEPIHIDGQAVPSQIEIAINFSAQGIVLSIDANTDISRLLLSRRGDAYAPCPLQELDAIPTPLATPAPAYPAELLQHGVRGIAIVEFYIDETGTVRMAVLKSADFWELGNLATAAVKDWKFAPPTKHGRPVLVRVQQRFEFGLNEP